MSQITTPLPHDAFVLTTTSTDRRRPGLAAQLIRAIARGRNLLPGRDDPLSTPSREAIESTGVPDITR